LEPVQEEEIVLGLVRGKHKGVVGSQRSRKPKNEKPRSNAVSGQATSHKVDCALLTIMHLAAPVMDRLESYYVYDAEQMNNLPQMPNTTVSVSSSLLSL
jgi:hypothetical protein